MTDFLNFLNTADLEMLTKVPGITTAIAGNIIEARPFAVVNDCLKVRGMGKSLLTRIQSAFEAGETSSESNAIIPVTEEAAPAFIEKRQPAQESVQEQGPSFWSRLGRAFLNFIRALLRLLITLAVIAGIGAGIYYGLPYINKTFIAPVEENAARVNQLENTVANLQSQLDEMNTRVNTVETSVEAHTASLQKLEEMQAAIESEIKGNNDKVLLELKHEVTMTRAFDRLGRARLYLAQSNFGLAKEDIQAARDLLDGLYAETNDEVLKQVVARLDLALGNLPDFPVVASGDLEIAWQILISGEAAVTAPTATFTPTPALLDTATPTPLPPATFTPTPTP